MACSCLMSIPQVKSYCRLLSKARCVACSYHTVFAVMGKERETDCRGSLSFSDFTNSYEGHPRKYGVRFSFTPVTIAVAQQDNLSGAAITGEHLLPIPSSGLRS